MRFWLAVITMQDSAGGICVSTMQGSGVSRDQYIGACIPVALRNKPGFAIRHVDCHDITDAARDFVRMHG